MVRTRPKRTLTMNYLCLSCVGGMTVCFADLCDCSDATCDVRNRRVRVLSEVNVVKGALPPEAGPTEEQLTTVKVCMPDMTLQLLQRADSSCGEWEQSNFKALKRTFLDMQERSAFMEAVSGPDALAALHEESENTGRAPLRFECVTERTLTRLGPRCRRGASCRQEEV